MDRGPGRRAFARNRQGERMENRSPYVLVGAAVLVFVAAMTVFIIWKLRAGGEKEQAAYEIFFSGEVQGLTNDSPVFYRGIRVGRVYSISLRTRTEAPRRGGTPRPIERIAVVIAVDSTIDIRERSRAVLERPLVTGAAFIQIIARPEESDEIKPKKLVGQAPYPEILEGSSFFQTTTTSAQELIAKAGQIADRINDALSPETVKAFNQILVNLADISAMLAKTEPAFSKTVNDLPETLADLRKMLDRFGSASERLDLMLAELGPQDEATRKMLAGRTPSELKQAMIQLRDALANVNSAAGNLNRTVSENRGAVRQFSEGGLSELSVAIRELRTLVANLNAISSRLDRDPAGYLLGGSRQGYQPR
ncbi:MAG TPA: MlaD family protein [Vineibacter terrae]|nr:MlaD family protein [Vineibacter terrae]